MYGISNLTFQFNMASNANRAWRAVRFNQTANFSLAGKFKEATIDKFENSQLHFMFITAHPTLKLNSRNIIPYYELNAFRTPGAVDLPARTLTLDHNPNAIQTQSVESSNMQLNMVPDKLIIAVRRIISKCDCTYSDNYASIQSVNITFNNAAGLLSNHTQRQLYDASVDSGLANLSWEEFRGSVVSVSSLGATSAETRSPYEGAGARLTSGGVAATGVRLTPTTGSLLVLDMATQVQLTESYLSCGSLGQFHCKIQVTCYNNEQIPWVAGDWEMVVIPMNSGIMAIERGVCNVYTGLLTKQDVVDTATNNEPHTRGSIKRMIGGGFLDSLKSGLQWFTSKLPMVKNVLSHIPNEYAQKGAKVLDAIGYGKHSKGKLENRIM
jgi:hypothetical protein